MYETDACYKLCEAIINLAWRDLRSGWQDARGFLLHGWVTRAMGVDAETVKTRILNADQRHGRMGVKADEQGNDGFRT